jgi:hypothetical protein
MEWRWPMSKKETISKNLEDDVREFLVQCRNRGYPDMHLLNVFMTIIVAIAMGGYTLTDDQKKDLHNIMDSCINRYEPLGKKPPKD